MGFTSISPQRIVDWAKNLLTSHQKHVEEEPVLIKAKPAQKLSYYQDSHSTYKEDIIPTHATIAKKAIATGLIQPALTFSPMKMDVATAEGILSNYIDKTELDSIKKSTTSVLDQTIETLSKNIDEELKKPNRDFAKLQEYVYKVVAAMMHRAKQVDQEFISQTGIEIKIQAVKVQGTYNTWPALLITVVSSAVSVAGGAAGITPFAPVTWISPDKAQVLAHASQGIGMAGTGLSSVGSIFNSKGEGNRFVLQTFLEEEKKKREDRESAKQQKSQTKGESLRNLNESSMELHRTISGIIQP